ncbi:MAG: hypothetical protein DMF61_11140 [Blastocatellia bacterium AA13]|nr:MAG: hypothetical protein DMF61_11140 [Blastocatellia bacterium AA13]
MTWNDLFQTHKLKSATSPESSTFLFEFLARPIHPSVWMGVDISQQELHTGITKERGAMMKVPTGPFEELWSHQCAGPVISVSATPNCSLISAASVNCDLHLLNENGSEVWDRPAKLDNEGWATSVSADGRFIAVGTASKKPADGTVYVFDRNRTQIWSEAIGAPVWSVSLSADGSYLAVSSWNNHVYKYKRSRESYDLIFDVELPGGSGLYGIKLAEDGRELVVSSYDTGVFILSEHGAVHKAINLRDGFYNVSVARNTGTIIAAMRDFSALLIAKTDNDSQSVRKLPKISSIAICGVDISDDGKLLGLGSFDGRLYITDGAGRCLWRYETDGEVWSVAMSGDGRLICIGSGDQSVRLFFNRCTASALDEVRAVEDSLECVHDNNETWANTLADTLVAMYLRYGIVEYGVSRLMEFREHVSRSLIRATVKKLLRQDIESNPTHYFSHLQLGDVLSSENDHQAAAYHYQVAASEPKYRSRALNQAGESFEKLKLKAASFSCFRRAREQHLDADAKRVLFNLAHSYEGQGEWEEAIRHYQLLVSWDARYRNAWSRMQNLISHHRSTDVRPVRTEYAGGAVSLLGPDTPRQQEVDDLLLPVIAARNSEVIEPPGLRARLEQVVSALAADEEFIRGITKADLDYTTEMYMKYEYLLPEDELKKFLETVNSISVIEDGAVAASLDIGAATGRYPSLLARRGIKTFGVDREYRAMSFAHSRKLSASRYHDWPQFFVGDAVALPAAGGSFDLVTCMMGTFAHIGRSQQSAAVKEMLRVLRPSGRIIISTWDVECEHLAFLSMYDEAQKEMIRQSSPRCDEIQALLEESGMKEISVVHFCMLPQGVVYDLGLHKLDLGGLRMALDIDLAVRATFPARHGEMYVATAVKH